MVQSVPCVANVLGVHKETRVMLESIVTKICTYE